MRLPRAVRGPILHTSVAVFNDVSHLRCPDALKLHPQTVRIHPDVVYAPLRRRNSWNKAPPPHRIHKRDLTVETVFSACDTRHFDLGLELLGYVCALVSCRPTVYVYGTLVKDLISESGNAIVSVRLSVRLFSCDLLNRLTFDLELSHVIEGQRH